MCRSGVKGEGGRAGTALQRTLRPPPFPTPSWAWGTYVVCGCCRAGTTARANALRQIVPNLSFIYILFYSVIYNSVDKLHHTLRPPPFPTPGWAWGTYVVCGCCRTSTTARANALTQIVLNSSSLYTLFYSFIYNSVGTPYVIV